MATKTLNAKGLNCPLPVLKAKKSIKGLETGDTLEVLSTDPGSVSDFDSFCKATGDQLLEQAKESDGVFRFLIQKS
ncbi:MAG: sulfurtransferase TusA family protein [Rhodospirillales bacterium]